MPKHVQFSFFPDIVLFATDIVTDWVNGANLIKNGDLIWGGIMVSLPFLPMTIALLWGTFSILADEEEPRWQGVLLLILLLPAAVVATPIYMVFVLFIGFVKIYKPDINDEDELLGGHLKGKNAKVFPALLRMSEMVGESYPQALLGE